MSQSSRNGGRWRRCVQLRRHFWLAPCSLALWLLSLAFCLWPLPSMAGGGAPCGQTINVGVSTANTIEQQGETEQYLAFQTAFFNELTYRTGCRFNLQADVPRARQVQLYLAGHLAILSGAIPTSQRDAAGWYVKMHRLRNVLVFHDKGKAIGDISSILGDPSMTIGVLRGGVLGTFWDSQIKAPTTRAHIDQFATLQAIFHLMASGRVDGVITNYTVYSDLLPIVHLTEGVTILDPPGNQDFYAGLYLSHAALTPDIAKLIGRTVEAMHADGSLARLYQGNTQAGTGDLFDFVAAPVDFSKCPSSKAACQPPTN